MSLFIKKPIPIQATRWWKNGDHPLDYAKETQGYEGGKLVNFSGQFRKDRGWEGSIVRRFRRPDIAGTAECRHCGGLMGNHGWIETLEGGHIVCPGDWIITGIKGECYPCKPDIFAETYEEVQS